jgi:hypothetical protein
LLVIPICRAFFFLYANCARRVLRCHLGPEITTTPQQQQQQRRNSSETARRDVWSPPRWFRIAVGVAVRPPPLAVAAIRLCTLHLPLNRSFSLPAWFGGAESRSRVPTGARHGRTRLMGGCPRSPVPPLPRSACWSNAHLPLSLAIEISLTPVLECPRAHVTRGLPPAFLLLIASPRRHPVAQRKSKRALLSSSQALAERAAIWSQRTGGRA